MVHATSICGAVGAAVALAMLHGQDDAGIASAAGIAASVTAMELGVAKPLAVLRVTTRTATPFPTRSWRGSSTTTP